MTTQWPPNPGPCGCTNAACNGNCGIEPPCSCGGTFCPLHGECTCSYGIAGPGWDCPHHGERWRRKQAAARGDDLASLWPEVAG